MLQNPGIVGKASVRTYEVSRCDGVDRILGTLDETKNQFKNTKQAVHVEGENRLC